MSNAIAEKLTRALKKELTKHRYIDVSAGAENFLYISRTRLNTILDHLIEEGYTVISIKKKGSRQPPYRLLCRAEDDPLKDILKQRKILTERDTGVDA